MGKKAKGGKKSAKKKGKSSKKSTARKGSPTAGGAEAEENNARKLVRELSEELSRETQYLNEFQQQEEKVETFWEAERKRLEELQIAMRGKLEQKLDREEHQQLELKNFQERIRHLLHEHHSEMTSERIASEKVVQASEDEHRTLACAPSGYSDSLPRQASTSRVCTDDQFIERGTERGLLMTHKELTTRHADFVRSLRLAHEANVTRLRKEFQAKTLNLKMCYEEKMRVIRGKADEKKKAEVNSITDLKTSHVEHLLADHKAAFRELKNYYTDITYSNLDLIKSLKAEVAEVRKREHAKEKAMMEIAAENRQLTEPFKRHLDEVEDLKQKLVAHEKDKAALREVKTTVMGMDQEMAALSWEREVRLQKYEQLLEERDELRAKLEESTCDALQKGSFRRLVLRQKLFTVKGDLEKKQTALHEVMVSMNMDPSALSDTAATQKLEDILQAKQDALQALDERIEQLRETYYEAVHFYQAAMRNHDVPLTELGFEPGRI